LCDSCGRLVSMLWRVVRAGWGSLKGTLKGKEAYCFVCVVSEAGNAG
jgi:hypothetical protein